MTDASGLRTDARFLASVQYARDDNLAARQAIFEHERPPLDLARRVLDLAELAGGERVADVGCGNALYLAELERRGHRGTLLGVDLSTGMLAAAAHRVDSPLLASDAAALPLAGASVDVVLAMHMLFHVEEPRSVLVEVRRVTRSGGELRRAVGDAIDELGGGTASYALLSQAIRLDDGEELTKQLFTTVVRHDFEGELVLADPGLASAYLASMIATQAHPEPERLVAVATAKLAAAGGTSRIRTHSGCLICR